MYWVFFCLYSACILTVSCLYSVCTWSIFVSNMISQYTRGFPQHGGSMTYILYVLVVSRVYNNISQVNIIIIFFHMIHVKNCVTYIYIYFYIDFDQLVGTKIYRWNSLWLGSIYTYFIAKILRSKGKLSIPKSYIYYLI